ncbi:MAG: hypothetical protein IT355_02515 [Gemmatimonadaceae bacterium]|nr:hypothetical protein [Gemmatimonadaceae bacterium]
MTIEPATAAPLALLYPELGAEMTLTRSMLALVPWERADWKPHPKSMTLGSLASHVAQLPDFLTAMAATDVVQFDPADFAPPPIANTLELLAVFDAALAKLHTALAGMDWARLDGSWKMMMGEYTILDNRRAYLLRHMGINHIVHHRAQLGVYLRLLDVAIPGSYGPSADTTM